MNILLMKIPLQFPIQLSKSSYYICYFIYIIYGDDRDRTGGLRRAKPTLSQLSYIPDPR